MFRRSNTSCINRINNLDVMIENVNSLIGVS